MTIIALAALTLAVLSLLVAVAALVRSRARRGGAASAPRPAPIAGVDSERLDAVGSQLAPLVRRLEAAEARGERSFHRIGVVRFNPFADTGSNQSFVLAVLNAHGDGFLLSSMHSRQQTRVFLKSLAGGRSDSALSAEETEAIRRATTN